MQEFIIRWKLWIYLLMALAFAITGGVYGGRLMTGIALAQAEADNRAFNEHLASAAWQPHRAEMAAGTLSSQFTLDMQLLAQGAGVKLRLYDPHGLLLFTTGGTLSNTEFSQMVQALNTTGSLSQFSTDGGEKWLRSFTVLGTPAAPEAYIELSRDLTTAWGRVFTLQWLTGMAIFIVCLILLLITGFLSRAAEIALGELHEENAALARSTAEAEARLEDKTLFLANISHELRTPLNAIIGFSNILKNEAAPEMQNATHKEYVHDIHQSGVHLLTLINDILDFSKADAGKLELEIEEVNATKLAANCLRLVLPRAEVGNIELVNAVPKQTLALETDSKKLKQVLLNLLSNAVKFTPEGGKVRLAAWHDEEEDAIVFQVNDSGVGIQPKEIAKALSEFGQVKNKLSERYEGTGLGLPLARKFVEVMGGKFAIHSEEGYGTTIAFLLPRVFKARENTAFKRIAV